MRALQGIRRNPLLVRKISLSLVFGLVIAACGSVPYYRPDWVVEGRLDWLFEVAGALFMPGLLIAAGLGGNLHDVSLGIGVIVNWLLYGACVFLILTRVVTLKRSKG